MEIFFDAELLDPSTFGRSTVREDACDMRGVFKRTKLTFRR
jgi:hypothetical protein